MSAAGEVGSVVGAAGRGGDPLCPASVLGGSGGPDLDTPVLPLVPQVVTSLVVISGDG